MKGEKYQICKRCIMDTSDAEIRFDKEGNCNHCNEAISLAPVIWFPNETGKERLWSVTQQIKKEGKNKEFDCIIGLSGGIDSSYLAYIAVKEGLRPLVVHVDCGWNSEIAVKNIENLVKSLNLVLHTFVVNWEDMKDLQRAFFKASLPDQDIPQDHAIFASLYNFAAENNIKYTFNGLNFATESILPSSWGHQAMDLRHIRAVHKQFGESRLKEYPTISFLRRYVFFNLIKRMNVVSPLNYLDYRKEQAMDILQRDIGWQYYGGKHHESRFTKFFQGYYLPKKFNIDKRRAHLSSMIVSGQVTREKALEEMSREVYSESEIEDDLEYVAKKLDWTVEEFIEILNTPPGSHSDFANNDFLFSMGLKYKRLINRRAG
jgi:N-acetyl sugar amidotransferase